MDRPLRNKLGMTIMSDITTDTKRVIPFAKPITDSLSPYMEPLLRVTTGLLLVPHGYGKLFGGGLEGTAQFFESVGFAPGYPFALFVALVEFFGGLALAAGFLTRPVAVLIVGFMAQATLFHAANGFMWSNGGFEYPLLWTVTALVFLVRGGGKLSVDRAIGREF